MPGSFPTLSKADLFARLAQGHAAGACVVTPTRRLAQSLRAQFDASQAAKGLPVWEDADVLPWASFVERCYEDALYADGGGGLPQLLSDSQAEALWAGILQDAGLVALPEAAAACAEAWSLAWQWGIAGALEKFPGSEDAAAFARWARAYARRCEEAGFIDAARLPELGARILVRKPKVLVLYGFDTLPPQHRQFIEGLKVEVFAARGEGRKSSPSSPAKIPTPSPAAELEAAARWARARLEAGAARIGIVVPDLEQRRREAVRVFTRAMQPAAHVPGVEAGVLPFNVSLGAPLADYPIVDAALGLLSLALGEVPWARASALLRSPFIAGAESGLAARALQDARLRRRAPPRVSLGKLVGLLEGNSRSVFERMFSTKTNREKTTHQWARHFTALLDAAGFPGERVLDSTEHQARARLNEALGELARLGRVLGEVDGARALQELERLCASLFQPESPEVPVQVLGTLESSGLEFDCLWVCGLTESAWPRGARPHPFLPVALQKKAGIPNASAEGALAFARRLTAGWCAAADEVVLSWPRKQDDQDFLPSPLLQDISERAPEAPSSPSWRDLIFRARALETAPDTSVPYALPTVKSGIRVLTDQAACPFRAFARHRLGAEVMEAPAEGLDARARGTLLHVLMAGIWKEVKGSAGLEGELGPVIERAAAAAVKEAGIEGRFADLERARLARLAREWLEIERGRGAFEVVAIEEPRPLKAGTLSFNGRIDRMDKLADGSHVLIDYKSAKQLTPRMWRGERPDEPQLPLYALSASEDVGAVAFARLRTGALRYMGYERVKGSLPQLTLQDWDTLRREWQGAIDGLAAQFTAGEARVDPKKHPATCRNCGLQTLCRVNEKMNVLSEANEDE